MDRPVLHEALIHVATDLVGGVIRAQDGLQKLQQAVRIKSISSIYKRFLSQDHVDLKASMEFVCRIQTEMSEEDLLSTLDKLDPKLFVNLLAFDSLIAMAPRLTLPFPELHTDPLIIRSAAEAWGQYEHPVYQKTLSELSRTAQALTEAEFFLQGRSLIDT